MGGMASWTDLDFRMVCGNAVTHKSVWSPQAVVNINLKLIWQVKHYQHGFKEPKRDEEG
jgi:hypothetical protein